MLAILPSSGELLLTSAIGSTSASLSAAFNHQNSPSSCRLIRPAQQQQHAKTTKATNILNNILLSRASRLSSSCDWNDTLDPVLSAVICQRDARKRPGRITSAITGRWSLHAFLFVCFLFFFFPYSLMVGFFKVSGHVIRYAIRRTGILVRIAWLFLLTWGNPNQILEFSIDRTFLFA